MVYEEVLADLFLRMIREGISLDQAITDDGNRISRRQFYSLKESEPNLVSQARAKAQTIVEGEREEASGALAAQQVIALGKVQERLTQEWENNIATAVDIRENSRSDFVRLQAAQTLELWRDKLSAVQPEEKKPLQLPAGRGSLMGLLNTKFAGGKFQAEAPDGSALTYTGPKPGTVIESS